MQVDMAVLKRQTFVEVCSPFGIHLTVTMQSVLTYMNLIFQCRVRLLDSSPFSRTFQLVGAVHVDGHGVECQYLLLYRALAGCLTGFPCTVH